MSDGLSPLELQAWAGFLRTHERLWRAIESGLVEMNLSVAEYDVLANLDGADPEGMRMSDLAEKRLMSSGGFTRLADRLERRGLIERRRSATDGRSLHAALTVEGRAMLRRAQRKHHADVRAEFLDHLTDNDLQTMAGLWERLGATRP